MHQHLFLVLGQVLVQLLYLLLDLFAVGLVAQVVLIRFQEVEVPKLESILLAREADVIWVLRVVLQSNYHGNGVHALQPLQVVERWSAPQSDHALAYGGKPHVQKNTLVLLGDVLLQHFFFGNCVELRLEWRIDDCPRRQVVVTLLLIQPLFRVDLGEQNLVLVLVEVLEKGRRHLLYLLGAPAVTLRLVIRHRSSVIAFLLLFDLLLFKVCYLASLH